MSISNNNSNKFDFRGINFKLLQNIGDYVKKKDPPGVFSVGRINHVFLGSHETIKTGKKEDGTLKNRWIGDISYKPESCVTYDAQSSLIDLLKNTYKDEQHPDLKVTYDEVVGEKANIFVSFTYQDDYFELLNGIEQFFKNNPKLNIDKTYFWFDMIVNNQWGGEKNDFTFWSETFQNAISEIGYTLSFFNKW
jgi:hypothetical protein